MAAQEENRPPVRTGFEGNGRNAGELANVRSLVWHRFEKTFDEITWAEMDLLASEMEAAVADARARVEYLRRQERDRQQQIRDGVAKIVACRRVMTQLKAEAEACGDPFDE